jgi:hypothetical protein
MVVAREQYLWRRCTDRGNNETITQTAMVGTIARTTYLDASSSKLLEAKKRSCGRSGPEAGRSAVRTVHGGGADGPRVRRVS